MSLWLNLIPQLHRPGVDELSMTHHHFQEEEPQYYDGTVRRYLMQRPSFYTPPTTGAPTAKPELASTRLAASEAPTKSTTSTECNNMSSGSGLGPAVDMVRPTGGGGVGPDSDKNLLNKWAPYHLYAPALLSAVIIGFLFLLNILIFVFICHQRSRSLREKRRKRRKRKEEICEINSCCSSSSDYHSESKIPVSGISFSHHQSTSTSPMVELQEFKSSPPSAMKRLSNCTTPTYPIDHMLTPSIPEPPPPPINQAGILRSQGCPQTPSSMKKRVQIQEISV